MSNKIGFVGLGAMGLPMARRILGGGHQLVVVPHRNRAPADELASAGAEVRESPRDLVRDCSLVISSVPDAPQVEEVLFGPAGLAQDAREGLLHMDMSTTNPSAARQFSERLAQLGIDWLDAPVSGGPARASDGSLTIMVGGKPKALARARPVLELLGQHIIHVGEAGAGQAVKLVNQLMISIIMIANAEALSLGMKSGVPLEILTQVIGTSSGSNYLMQNWLPHTLFAGTLEGGFALDLLIKDLNSALRWSAEMQMPAFGGALAQQLYRLAQVEGAGKLDYSVVARFYEEAAGVQLRLPRATQG
jgi:3-hydroxyisobutyrate dehydrogenase-like beta-hydroxyacid dehydrogenase